MPAVASGRRNIALRQAGVAQPIDWHRRGTARKARQSHRAALQGNQPSLRHSTPANLLHALTIAPLVQSLPGLFRDPDRNGHAFIAVAMGALDVPTGAQRVRHIFLADTVDYFATRDGLSQSDRCCSGLAASAS